MASIRKRGRKWQAQVRRHGSSALSKTFFEKSDALKWARQVETDLDKGIICTKGQVDRNATLGDLLSRYRDNVIINMKSGPEQHYKINMLLRDPIASHSVKALAPSLFSDYRDRRIKHVLPQTARKELVLFQRVLNVAMREWGLQLHQNPLTSVEKPPPGKARDRRLEPHELTLLMAATQQSRNPNLKPMILFAIETGMRLGELLSLRWEDINVDKSLALLRHTKNGWPRTVPLSRRAVEILKELPSTNGERVFATTAVRRHIKWNIWRP
ncbi:MAG: site-specific integrase, partial [Rhodospirillales bacterium]|nr:site-specific integrase [Rhodospirillales bacterium]